MDGQSKKRSIGIRPFITSDFMTGISAFPGRDFPEEILLEMVNRVNNI